LLKRTAIQWCDSTTVIQIAGVGIDKV